MKKANSLMQYSKKFPKRIFAYVASSRNDAFNDTLPPPEAAPQFREHEQH